MAKKTATKHSSSHPILLNLLLMVLVSIIIIALVFLGIRIYSRHGKEYVMPELIGSSIDDVSQTDSIGLRYVVIDSVYQDGDAGGTILQQDPKAGTMIKAGRKVYLTITSYSHEDLLMPHTSPTATIAISTLEKMGLLGSLSFVENADEANSVLRLTYNGYDIHEGEKLEPGTRIDVTIACRPGERKILPQVVGKSAADARRELHRNMFNIGKEHYKHGVDHNNAYVLRTEPAYNGINQYTLGTAVEIWYGEQDDAQQSLRDYQVDSSLIIMPATESEDSPEQNGIVW